MKNTNIYFIRHGEVFNPKNIIYGQLPNFKLSKLGEFQAQVLKKYFRNIGINIYYSSPLFRAKETAIIIADNNVIHKDKKLIEINIRSWEGVEKNKRDRKEVELYINHPEKFLNFGESVPEVIKRTNKFITNIIKKHQGKNIAVITHGEVIAAVQVITGLIDFSKINMAEIRNASITRLEISSKLEYKRAEYYTVAPAQKDMV